MALLKVRRTDAMAGVSTLPKHKAVVMLDSEDYFFHSCTGHSLAPLVGIELLEGKKLGVFEACTPLPLTKGVGAKMNEGNKLVFKGSELIGSGHHMSRLLQNIGGSVMSF